MQIGGFFLVKLLCLPLLSSALLRSQRSSGATIRELPLCLRWVTAGRDIDPS